MQCRSGDVGMALSGLGQYAQRRLQNGKVRSAIV